MAKTPPPGFWPSSVRLRVLGYGLAEARNDPGRKAHGELRWDVFMRIVSRESLADGVANF